MKRRIVAISTIAAIGISFGGASAQAATPKGSDAISPRSCQELGKHYDFGKTKSKYLPGTYRRNYLDPGASYTITKGRSSTVSGSVKASVGADFFKIAHEEIGVSASKSVTVEAKESYSWKNTSKKTKWVQLGGHAKSVKFTEYNVVPPCKITDKSTSSAVLPTGEPWIRHN